MMRGPAISGRIFDEGGKSKASAHVELLRMEFRDGQQTLLASDISMVTDRNGEYRLPGLPPGEYYLRVRPRVGAQGLPAGVFPRRHGFQLRHADYSSRRRRYQRHRSLPDARKPAFGAVDGRDRFARSRKSGAIFLHHSKTQRRERNCGSGSVPYCRSRTPTSVLCSPPGSYEIEVYLRDPDPIRWAHTTVEIVNRDVDAGKLVIGPGVWIRGQITAAEQLPVGVRRGQLQVTLRPLDGSIFLVPSAQVADDGSFVIPRVPERRFRVDLTGLPPEVYFSSARFGGREILNSGFMASADATKRSGPLDRKFRRSRGGRGSRRHR